MLGSYYNSNQKDITKAAESYANKMANFTNPKAVSTTVNWNIKKVSGSNKLIIGPLKASFAGQDDISYSLSGASCSICKADGSSTTIKNNTNFYLKVNSLDYAGGKFTLTVKKNSAYILDGYVYQDDRHMSGAQKQLFAAVQTGTISKSVEFKLTAPSIKIVKRDKDTNAVVKKAGFKFKLVGDTGATYNLTTNSSGEATKNPIRPGKYTITETSVGSNTNYLLNTSSVQKTVTGATTVDIKNKKAPNLKMVKKDKDTGAVVKKAGFVFKVTGPNNFSKTVTTNAQGEALINSIQPGKYKVVETSVGNNKEYELNTTPVEKTVAAGSGTVEVVISNRKQANLKIIKKDKETGAVVKKAGFKFKVTGPNNFSKEVTTNSQGEAIINSVKLGKYTVTETSVGNNNEYDCNFYPVSVTKNITTGGTIEIPMVNEKIGWLKIIKKDKYTGEAMKGVTFTVTGPNNYSKDVTTNDKGEAIIKPIPKGTYTVTEKSINGSIGNNWQYEASSSVKATITVKSGENPVTLKNQKEFINVSGRVFEDNPTNDKQSARNEKYGEANDKLIKGIKVSLYDKETKKVEKTVYTDENGKYKFEKVRISKIRNEKNDNNKGYNIIFEYDGLEWTNVVPYDINSWGGSNSSKAKEKDADRTAFNNDFAIIKGKGNNNQANRQTGERFNASNTSKGILNYTIKNVNGTDAKKAELKTVISNVTGKKVRQMGDGKGGNLSQNYFKINADINTANHYLGKTYKYADSETKLNDYKSTEIPNNNLGLYIRPKPDIAVVKDIENIKLTLNGKTQIYQYSKRYKHLKEEKDGTGYDVGVKFGNKYQNMSYTRAIYESDYKYDDTDDTKELQAFITYKITLKNQATTLTAIVNNMVDYYDKEFVFNTIGTTIDQNGDNITGEGEFVVTNDETSNATSYNKLNISKKPTKEINIPASGESNIYVRFKLTRKKIEDIVENNSKINQNNILFINNIVEVTSYSTKYAEGNRRGQWYAGVDSDSNPGNTVAGDETTYEDDTDKCPSLKLVRATERQMLGTVFEDNSGIMQKTRQGDGIYNPNEETIPNVIVTYKEEQTGNVYKTKTVSSDKSNVEYRIRPANAGDKTKEEYGEDLDITKTFIIEETNPAETTYLYDPITINNMKKGNYCIGHFIPGNYKLTFTWGDKEHTVQDWKATVYKLDTDQRKKNANNMGIYTDWYIKEVDTRYSDALDNYDTRKTIDNQIINVKHDLNVKKLIESEYDKDTSEYIRKMDSTTPGMDIGVEMEKMQAESNELQYDGGKFKNIIENIDFGIALRPQQTLAIYKKVKRVKATLANGQVIVNDEVTEDGAVGKSKIAQYRRRENDTNKGYLKLEMDNELIQGCLLEVQYELGVENISEIDYAYEDFYNYGTQISMTNPQKVQYAVKLEAKTIMDYLDSNWVYKEHQIADGSETNTLPENSWIYITDAIKNQYLEENVTQSEDYKNVKTVYTQFLQGKKLVPDIFDNEADYGNNATKAVTVPLSVSKVLSTTDEIELNNQAEIVEVNKTGENTGGGGALLTTTPGNYVPALQDKEKDDNIGEPVIVVPSTGENRNYILPIGIGIVALLTLGVGIIIIRKRVLTK